MAGAPWNPLVGGTREVSWRFGGLPGAAYEFRVRARDRAANVSAPGHGRHGGAVRQPRPRAAATAAAGRCSGARTPTRARCSAAGRPGSRATLRFRGSRVVLIGRRLPEGRPAAGARRRDRQEDPPARPGAPPAGAVRDARARHPGAHDDADRPRRRARSSSTRWRRFRESAAAALLAALGVAGAASAAPEPPAAVSGANPRIEQMVVFRSGKASVSRVRARATTGASGRRAAAGSRRARRSRSSIRSRPGRLGLRDDFGSCPASAAGVYVVADRSRRGGAPRRRRLGLQGGAQGRAPPAPATRAARSGAGAFAAGQRVLWFYCRRAGDCQRTLGVRASEDRPAR